jgi:hypothetical protein
VLTIELAWTSMLVLVLVSVGLGWAGDSKVLNLL